LTTGLPNDTVTFLFTDIEGSTKLLDELGPERHVEALDRHRHVASGRQRPARRRRFTHTIPPRAG
jgi:class 3 adenylate cyclase